MIKMDGESLGKETVMPEQDSTRSAEKEGGESSRERETTEKLNRLTPTRGQRPRGGEKKQLLGGGDIKGAGHAMKG